MPTDQEWNHRGDIPDQDRTNRAPPESTDAGGAYPRIRYFCDPPGVSYGDSLTLVQDPGLVFQESLTRAGRGDSSMSDTVTVPTRRRRGPLPTGQRMNDVSVTFFDHESRRMGVLMQRRGLGSRGRARLLRDLLLAELDRLGIEDPGPAVDQAEVTAA